MLYARLNVHGKIVRTDELAATRFEDAQKEADILYADYLFYTNRQVCMSEPLRDHGGFAPRPWLVMMVKSSGCSRGWHEDRWLLPQ